MAASWTIPGADGQPIYGNTHSPKGEPRGVLVICHGFKGYKDYGFFPHLAEEAARAGLVAHRFNFSHSGMTNNAATFERPELFERDTWGKQIHDITLVHEAVKAGRLGAYRGQPVAWFGHSRGGVTVLLTAARLGNEGPDRLVATASPHSACFLDDDQKRLLRKQGWVASPSSRTGQELRVGVDWLTEIEANPEAFDPLLAIRHIEVPILLIHGETDSTVPVSSSQLLQRASGQRATLTIIPNAGHTFNAPNPLPLGQSGQSPPPETRAMIDAAIRFAAPHPYVVS